jgi:predicted amidohydrolase YtcJ
MKRSLYGMLILAVTLASCFVSPLRAGDNNRRERVLYNAKIFTGDSQHPYAEAIAIRGDKIVAVGTRAEASSAVEADAESIDLQGETLLPGFIDSHIHAVHGGVSLITADVTGKASSIPELVAFAAEAKKSGKGMRGDLLYIGGLPLAFWSKIDELNAQFNSGPYANQPVYLSGMDGHTGWANRALLQRAGITREFIAGLSPAERPYYGIGAGNQPNGFAVDLANEKIETVVPEIPKEQIIEAGRAAVHYLHSLGITSWLDAIADTRTLTAYRYLAEHGELTAHVEAMALVNPRNDPTQELAAAQKLRKDFSGLPNLTIPGIKVFADGVAEIPSQTAALTKPYKNTGKSGDLLFDPATFAVLVTAADKQGLIVHVHALGDRAVKETLNGIAAARKANGNSGLPHTLTHVQFADPEDIPRFHQLGAIAALQLFWAAAEPDSIELLKPYVAPELYPWQYPARSLLDNGATISGASDWPVSTPNVFFAIYQAETRKGPEGVLDATQRVPREAMLYAYTINSARAMNQQDAIGSLAPGKQADYIILDRDILTVPVDDFRETQVLQTVVAGQTVYQAHLP